MSDSEDRGRTRSPGSSADAPSPSHQQMPSSFAFSQQQQDNNKAKTAAYHYLPKQSYGSIEYPGPVSDPSAILNVCTQEDINECFNASSSSSSSSSKALNAGQVLEMRYRPDDGSGVPVRGHRAASQKLLLKITRRRRKQRSGTEGKGKGKGKGEEKGIFTAEVVGSISQTVRFRSMADWHYTPNVDGQTAQLINSLKALDYNAILDYSFPLLNEDFLESVANPLDPDIKFGSTLDLQPPPLFSSRNLPYVYNFKMPNQVVEEEVYDNRTGQTKSRYVNKARTAGVGPINIPYKHTLGEVPKEPATSAKAKIPELDPILLDKLKKKFEERPVWMRHSLYNQFDEKDKRELQRIKTYVPCVAYIMGTGPFWKCLIRFGYDPCADPHARQYQRIFFYPNKKVLRNPLQPLKEDSEDEEGDEDVGNNDKGEEWWKGEQEKLIQDGSRPPLDPSKEHVFDGQYLHRRRGDYQLCDITDPLVAKYINDKGQFSNTCSVTSGWYKEGIFTLIKNIVRIKYMYMWENSKVPSDSMCYGVIEDYERGKLGGGRTASVSVDRHDIDEDEDEEEEEEDGYSD